jgi:hypothetical protein
MDLFARPMIKIKQTLADFVSILINSVIDQHVTQNNTLSMFFG